MLHTTQCRMLALVLDNSHATQIGVRREISFCKVLLESFCIKISPIIDQTKSTTLSLTVVAPYLKVCPHEMCPKRVHNIVSRLQSAP